MNIPEGSTLIQEGLYKHEYEIKVAGAVHVIWELLSADGYHFYNLDIPENYDDDGNLKPADQLDYSQYLKMPADAEYLKNIISVSITDSTTKE